MPTDTLHAAQRRCSAFKIDPSHSLSLVLVFVFPSLDVDLLLWLYVQAHTAEDKAEAIEQAVDRMNCTRDWLSGQTFLTSAQMEQWSGLVRAGSSYCICMKQPRILQTLTYGCGRCGGKGEMQRAALFWL